IGIQRDQLPSKLIQLLTVPSHLNVFSLVASNNKSFGATSISDLYISLWRKKVRDIPKNSAVKTQRVKDLLYNIASVMFESQRITVSEYRFEEYSDELSYLESERLIKCERNQ